MNQTMTHDLDPHRTNDFRTILRHVTRRSLVGLAFTALAFALYWTQLLTFWNEREEFAERQARLRAMHTSSALSILAGNLVSSLEYAVRSLAQAYEGTGADDAFDRLVGTTLQTFPPGSIALVAVADARGRLVYSSVAREVPVSVADREYFRAQFDGGEPRLFIGRPGISRISGAWGISFSYPIARQGRKFSGIVLLSVSPDYVSNYFRKVFAADRDSAMLLLNDGSYLARTSRQKDVLGRQVPAEREFLRNPLAQNGEYRVAAAVDGIERYYAWHRVPRYPLIVSIGLDREQALASTRAAARNSLYRNALGTVIVLGAALWIALLFARLRRDSELLAANEERYRFALDGGNLGAWDWDLATGRTVFDARWCAILGYGPDELEPGFETIRRIAHPDDLGKIQEALDAHIDGRSTVFQVEHRSRHRDGTWVWISARGKITHRAADGRPLRMLGTQCDVSRRVSETLLRRALLDNSGAEIFLSTPERGIRFSNRRAVDTFSPDGGLLDGCDFRVIHCDEASYAAFRAHYETVRAGKEIRTEYPLRTACGEIRWFSGHGTLLDPAQPDGDVIWTMIDITDRRRAEEALAAAHARLTEIIEHVPGGMLVEDEAGRVVIANQTLCELLSSSPTRAAVLIGQDHDKLCHLLAREVLDVVDDCTRPGGGERTRETVLSDGRAIRVSLIPVRHGDSDVGRLWVIHDITEQRRREQSLELLASTDTLTGLANRRAFMARLEAELTCTAGRSGGILAMLDLDHFKRINDTYGHAAGDAVLVHLARILRGVLRREDVAGRLGGEEFAVLLPYADPDGAVALAERLRTALADSRIETAAGAIRVTMSLGLAPLSGNAESTLARADAALYRAKHEGRNRVAMSGDGVANEEEPARAPDAEAPPADH